VLDNLVEGAVEGIHVGVSDAGRPGRERADTVVISRNVVHALVPRFHDRGRHAVFVGNARSVHVETTAATLRRTGKGRLPPTVTPVDGIRVHGELGPYLKVGSSSLDGFAVGVRVTPLGTPPKARMWLVAETMADGAGSALIAPQAVDRERNFA
jgi:hypothetical protein